MAFSQWIENVPATGAVAVFNIKEMLKAAGWTVDESSDGTTYNNSGDEISSGAAGAGGLDNTNAWFRISNPDGVEYTVQRTNTNQNYRVKCSPVATFTGGSPGATQTPSATDEGVILGGGTDAAPTGEAWFGGASGTYRHKGGADDASPYHFWSGTFPTGGGTQNHGWVHEGLDAVEPTDGAAFHVVIGVNNFIDGNLTGESESGGGMRSFATVAAVSPATWTVMPALVYTSTLQAIPVASGVSPPTTLGTSRTANLVLAGSMRSGAKASRKSSPQRRPVSSRSGRKSSWVVPG